ncbi:hypothetical protein [Streptomyces sp. NPDC047097]|uniref:hypothetical protein n=1 Tax=Streptomyces sp. NPDC047097 TaxID=3155260 RepID=UPI0033F39C8D
MAYLEGSGYTRSLGAVSASACDRQVTVRAKYGFKHTRSVQASIMQMTEPLATTIAAVAPVILLLGLVEIDQLRKEIAQSVERSADWSLRSVAIMERLTDDGESVSDEEFQIHMRGFSGPEVAAVRLLQLNAWLIFCLAMLAAEVLSLKWLGDPNAGADPGLAKFVTVAVSVGFSWVMFVPIQRIRRSVSIAAKSSSAAHERMVDIIRQSQSRSSEEHQ